MMTTDEDMKKACHISPHDTLTSVMKRVLPIMLADGVPRTGTSIAKELHAMTDGKWTMAAVRFHLSALVHNPTSYLTRGRTSGGGRAGYILRNERNRLWPLHKQKIAGELIEDAEHLLRVLKHDASDQPAYWAKVNAASSTVSEMIEAFHRTGEKE